MYIVVLEGTGRPHSNHKGIRTYIDFKTKEEFDAFRAENDHDKIAGEDVTVEEATLKCAETTIEAYVDSAYAEALNRDGSVNVAILRMKIDTAIWAKQNDLEERAKKRLEELARLEVQPSEPKQIEG